MAPTRTLNVVIAGDPKPLGLASKQADKHIATVEKGAGRMGKAVKAGFVTAAAGAGILVVGLKSSVDAAVEAEKSQAKLKAQLNSSGASYRAHAKEIDAVIQKHSRLAGVDDEDLQDAFTNLVRSTGSVNKAMKDMGLVTDLMRGKNISASKASDLLAKVHNGNVGALKRLGIALDPVTKAQDKLKESNKNATAEQKAAAKEADKAATSQKGLAALQKRFGGQAEAYGKTAAGAQDRFAVALENVQEKLGGALLPVLATVGNAVAKFLDEIDRGTGTGGRFAEIVSGAFTRVKGAIEAAIPTVTAVFEKIRSGVESALPAATAAFEKIKDAVTEVVDTVKDLVKGFEDGEGGAVAIVAVLGGATAAFVAYKVAVIAAATATRIAAAVTKAYTVAQAALNIVMSANPLALIALALIGLGAALVIAYKKSETFRGIVDGVFSKVKSIVSDVMDFVAPKVEWAFDKIKTVVGDVVGVVKGYVDNYAKAAKAIVKAIVDAFDFLKDLPGKVAGFFSSVTKKIRDWVGNFSDAAVSTGKAIGKGIIDGLGNLGHLILDKTKDALGFVADNVPGIGLATTVGKAIGKKIGDGAGKAVGTLGGGLPAGTFGGNLMGARPSMAPFAAAASRFGLGVSSGRRDGAITSSGNVSYHSTGEAIDVAGSPAGMLGFFRQMKAKFGGKLAELIYTPGGAGVKDGRAFTYGGQVAADHNDHVHVAYDTGTPGVGDGIGRGRALARTGDGTGRVRGYAGFYQWAVKQKLRQHMGTGAWYRALRDYAKAIGANPDQVAKDHGSKGDSEQWLRKWNRGAKADGIGRVRRTGDGLGKFVATAYGPPWNAMNGSGVTANGTDLRPAKQAYGVAVDPSVIPLGSKLKITPNPFNYSGTFTAFDTGGAIKGNRIDFYDWRGRQAQLGWGRKSVSVSTGNGKSTSHGGKGGKGASKIGQKGSSSGGTASGGSYNPESIYASDAPMANPLTGGYEGAQGFTQQRGSSAPAPGWIPSGFSRGIRGPVKGISTAEGDARAAAADIQPAEFVSPFAGELRQLGAQGALAALTPDLSDDIAVAQRVQDIRGGELDLAKQSGDPDRIREAAENFKSAIDNLAGLKDAVEANTAALKEQRESFERLIAEDYRAQYNVSQSQYGILAQAIADVTNGSLGQRLGLSLSGLRSAPGAVART